MVLNGWRRWFKRLSSSSRRPRSFRPLLEALEDRRLLAAFVVNSAGDDPDGNYLAPYNDHIGDTGDSPLFDGDGHLIGFTPFTGECTLRAAIQQANADGAPATITFAPSVHLIGTAGLPPILVPIVIDGTNAAGKPGVELVGGPGSLNGLELHAGGSTIKGMVIHGFSHGAGIALGVGGGGNHIEDNYLGTDVTGTVALPNSIGVGIDHSAGNTIGGTTPAARNLISGNTFWGVSIYGFSPSASGNVVEGNYIGTDVTGLAALGNGQGVTIGAFANTIGGTTGEATRNIISGNTKDGVFLQASAVGNVVAGNYIGTDKTGAAILPNMLNGVDIAGASSNTIGGTAPGTANVISGNFKSGVLIAGGTAKMNLVQGNFIGTNADGTAALAGQDDGVDLVKSANSNTVGGGGAARNIIAGYGLIGVFLSDTGTTANVVQGNYLGTDKTGKIKLSSGEKGVDIEAGASGNIIGGRVGTTSDYAGNVLVANTTDGVRIGGAGTTGNVVQGNFLGTDVSGTLAKDSNGNALGNFVGVDLVDGAAGNILGGVADGAGNVISGSTFEGVRLSGMGTTANVVLGNRIGTDKTGTLAKDVNGNPFGNHGNGVNLYGGAAGNTIGGTAAGAGNVVAANTKDGILIEDDGTTGNLVQGNFIGTDITGTLAKDVNGNALGNHVGVNIIHGAANNTIGGSAGGAGNVISANTDDGIDLVGAGTNGNVVQGNFLGTDVSGTLVKDANGNALGNRGIGVLLSNGAANNTIGGATPGAAAAITPGAGSVPGLALPYAGNLIAGNGLDTAGGVRLGADTTGNLVQGNCIGTDRTGTLAKDANGNAFGNFGDGVDLRDGATGNTIGGSAPGAGNVISGNGLDNGAGNAGNGVTIEGAGTNANVVQGNAIGTDRTGSRALDVRGNELGNNGDGVALRNGAANNTIGGVAAGAGNVISGNDVNIIESNGVRLTGAGTTGNLVQGNFIGTDVTGTLAKDANGNALGNHVGVDIDSGAANNTIGGVVAGAGNVISANGTDGVYIYGADTTGNVVQGNLIGTDITGTLAKDANGNPLGNGHQGVNLRNGAAGNTIGGVAAGARNIISANVKDGVRLSDGGTTMNLVQSNYIGVDSTGAARLGNGDHGVDIVNGATTNTIGGGAGARNVISGNGKDGVFLGDAGTTMNLVQGNFIGTDNTGKAKLGNTLVGVVIAGKANNNTIGGAGAPPAGLGNVISGNGSDGVRITDNFTNGNNVQGNFIGLDVMGAQLGNAGDGVAVVNGAANNTIGGAGLPLAGSGNVISGNGGDGVRLAGAGTTGNVVQGNFIGTDTANQQQAVPNTGDGVAILAGATNNTIGGPGLGNVVSGNGGDGLSLAGAGTKNNLVQGNYIGVDVTGRAKLANAGDGVAVANGAANNTIGGAAAGQFNVISGNGGDGVSLAGTGTMGNLVQGNFIGTDNAGRAVPNTGDGVALFNRASNNTIGGAAAGLGNVISGNTQNGVSLSDAGTTGNLVQGNFIGTDNAVAAGLRGVPNKDNGVLLDNGASGNTIGGAVAGAGNHVSANGRDGVRIADAGTSLNLVQGNRIGNNGNAAVPDAAGNNQLNGVNLIQGASNNTIGGTVAAARNIISGNFNGVRISDTGTSGNVVQGNFIGTNAAGAAALANTNDGVKIVGGAAGNTIGGTAAGAGNVIAGNGRDGIFLSDAGTSLNLVQGNFIGVNNAANAVLANGKDGVALVGGATDNTVGGSAAGAGNVIAGNNNDGVFLSGGGTTGNLIQGNAIGTNLAGAGGLGNGANGVEITAGAAANTIGGTGGAGNIISGNTGDGVSLSGDGTTANAVQGNLLGLVPAGNAALANGGSGVNLLGGAAGNLIGTPGAGNTISGNRANGVALSDLGTSGNLVQGNFIGTDLGGTIAVPNVGDGVSIVAAAADNSIGGAAAGAGNLISGNTRNGVFISDEGTMSNRVQGNFLGTNASGNGAVGNGATGVVITGGASANVVGGPALGAHNLISGNGANGVTLSGNRTRGNLVQNNFIGTVASGGAPLGNALDGVDIVAGAVNNAIGGTSPSQRNVISGNPQFGVLIAGNGTMDNLVAGNFIGTNAAGNASVANGFGVALGTSAQGNTIGGTTAGFRNVISGNVNGVYLADAGTSGNLVQGNFIGTDLTGTKAVANSKDGVEIVLGASSNTIGGTAAGAGNVIAGNLRDGVFLSDAATPMLGSATTTLNLVQGNFIGTDVSGFLPLANGARGVEIANGAAGNTIGGTVLGAGNTLAFNGTGGVAVTGAASTGNGILGNAIFANSGLGIDLGGDGVTANDSQGHVGPNNFQNFPVLTSVVTRSGTTTVQGTLNGTPQTTFRIEFFGNLTADPSGFGQGQTIVGSTAVTTDAQGNATFTFSLPQAISVGSLLAATASDPNNNTSEFSRAVVVNNPLPVLGGINPAPVVDREVLTSTGLRFRVPARRKFMGSVATFTTTNLGKGASDFTVTIHWGDGSAAGSGTITFSGGLFRVTGSHTFRRPGNYKVTVTIRDEGGSSVTSVGRVRVLPGLRATRRRKPARP